MKIGGMSTIQLQRNLISREGGIIGRQGVTAVGDDLM